MSKPEKFNERHDTAPQEELHRWREFARLSPGVRALMEEYGMDDLRAVIKAPKPPLGDADRRETPPCENGECKDHYGDPMAWCVRCRPASPQPDTPAETPAPPWKASYIEMRAQRDIESQRADDLQRERDAAEARLSSLTAELTEARRERDAITANRDGLKQLCDEHYAALQESEAHATRLLDAYEEQQDRAVQAGEAFLALTTQIEGLVKWANEQDASTGQAFEELRDELAALTKGPA